MATTTHTDPRRIAVWSTLAIGAVLIAATLRVERGSAGFYLAGFALAAVWTASSFAFGHVRLWGPDNAASAQVVAGVVLGGLTFALFVGGKEIGSRISFLAGPIDSVLGKADAGPLAAVLTLALVNGVAEELYFRGALHDSLPVHLAATISTVAYVAVTAMGGNTALTVAAVVMGIVFVVARRISGGLVTPIVTHLVWSTLVILFLPR